MSTKFDLDEIGSILDLLSKNDVREFKLERDNDRLWLRRGPADIQPVLNYGSAGAYPVPAVAQQIQGSPGTAASTGSFAPGTSPVPAVAEIPTPPRAVPVTSNIKEIKSPMVGTFYRRPAVDAKAFVSVGDTVKKGQVLCIVEAMKLMNEIESEVAGRIVEVCLEDATMVEYSEVLFRIEPL